MISRRSVLVIGAMFAALLSTGTPAPQRPAHTLKQPQAEATEIEVAEQDAFMRLEQASKAAGAKRTAADEHAWSEGMVIYLSSSILALTALALLLGSLILWKRNASGQEVLRLFGIVIIVGFSAILLVTSFNNEQLTPITGLFGAIAGYLLGKDARAVKSDA